jgi:hypothetical protein
VSDEAGAWSLLQLAALLRTGQRLLRPGIVTLEELTAELPEDRVVRVSTFAVQELHEIGETLAELAGRMQALLAQLPDGDLEVTSAALAREALEDLAQGILDPLRLRLAASAVPAGAGWCALARSLRTTDAHTAWEGIGAEQLLGCFRGADPRLVQRVVAVAELPAGAFPAYDTCDVVRLVAALEEHAPVEA